MSTLTCAASIRAAAARMGRCGPRMSTAPKRWAHHFMLAIVAAWTDPLLDMLRRHIKSV
jgi:hypothetical protein